MDMRRIVATGTAAVALAMAQPARASVGDAALEHPEADGGAQKSVPQHTGPAGTFLGPLPLAVDSDPERRYPLKPHAGGGLFYEAPQFSAEVAPDGTVTFHDKRLRYEAPKLAFTFDLTDEFVHDLRHGTLYPYEKANFLAATFKQRTGMAAAWYAGQMRAARKELPRRLDALWGDTRYRRRERRLLWEDIDRGRADARPAATTIEAWIRKRLPRGAPDGYTDNELDACARESVAARQFRPYGSPLEMRWPAQ
jgi:hypothetical protein